MNELINTATSIGDFNGLLTEMTTEAVVVKLVDDLFITKSADRVSWASGYLTYTIEIDNQSLVEYETPVVTDIIDPTIAKLVAGTVMIDGTPAVEGTDYTYVAATGLLTVNLTDVDPASKATIVFQVERV